ncbi:hypothetical protein KAW04_02640 [Candidatus Bathyarchaeota archaeon]|nr:hypothetical protein [Candidatus Bathyarchaeota archaeon]
MSVTKSLVRQTLNILSLLEFLNLISSGSTSISTRIDEKEMKVTLFREEVKVDINDLSIIKHLIRSSKLVNKAGTGKKGTHITSVLRQLEGVAKKLADNDQTIVLSYKGKEILKLGKNARPGLTSFIAEHMEIVDKIKAIEILTNILL